MRVVVSSNCMTGGITAAFRVIFPQHDISPLPYSALPPDDFTAALQGADIIVHSGPRSLLDGSIVGDAARRILFPELYFNAFHPDQVYAWMPDGSIVESATGPYNSAVALWSWQNGLSASQTEQLFTPDVFQALGYHDRWAISVERLRHDFTPFPHLDYRDFIEPLNRSGCFMHTVNHPKVSAIAQMARVLAKQVDPSIDAESVPLESVLIDSLFNASFAWAVYPSVANALGLRSAFLWKLDDHSVIGLREFLHLSFEKYDIQQPTVVDCHELKWPAYTDVLPRLAEACTS